MNPESDDDEKMNIPGPVKAPHKAASEDSSRRFAPHSLHHLLRICKDPGCNGNGAQEKELL
jgi:hypothetical protein